MIEIPEANVLASQLIETILDKKISETKVPESPGKFSFYNGDPQSYNKMLSGGTVSGAKAVGGFIELNTVSENLLFGDGVELTYHPDGSKIPKRIPGLGNSVLQDILWKAKLHPRRKVNSLNEEEKDALFSSIKKTLRMMTEQGGRDTEKDLFSNKGGYETAMSNAKSGTPCPVCGSDIVKENYLGGKSISVLNVKKSDHFISKCLRTTFLTSVIFLGT